MTFSAGINGFHDSEWFRIPTCPAFFLSLWCHSKIWSDPQPEMIYRIFLHRFNRMNVQLSWVCFRWWCVFPMENPPCGDFFHHASHNPFLRSYWIPPPQKIWFPTESIHLGSTEVFHMGIGVLGNWSRNHIFQGFEITALQIAIWCVFLLFKQSQGPKYVWNISSMLLLNIIYDIYVVV